MRERFAAAEAAAAHVFVATLDASVTIDGAPVLSAGKFPQEAREG